MPTLRTSPTAPTSTRARAGPRCGPICERYLPRVKQRCRPGALRRGTPPVRRRRRGAREPEALAELRDFLGAQRALRFHDQRLSRTAPFTARGSRRRSISPTGSMPSGSPTPIRWPNLLAALLPEAASRAASAPCPGAFKPRRRGAGRDRAHGRRDCPPRGPPVRLRERTGQDIALALEPEPCCLWRPSRRRSPSSRQHLLSAGGAGRLRASSPGLARGEAEAALRRHLGVCYDVCHAAVEFEDAGGQLGGAARRRHRRSQGAAQRGARIASVRPEPRGCCGRSTSGSTCTRWSRGRADG